MGANICERKQLLEVRNHEEQLFIILVAQEGFDWYAVCKVEGKWDNWIVNNDHIFDVSVRNYRQIFHIYALLGPNAILPVEAMLDQATLRVNKVENGISVVLFTSCENTYFVHRAKEC